MKSINHKNRVGRLARESGFSLVEIIIAIALIGMILGLVVVNSDSIFGGGQKKVAQLFVTKTIDVPLMAYRTHVGNYPSTEEGLNALIKAPSGKSGRWQGPYIKDPDSLIDPWGNKYNYRYPGAKNKNGYDVWSTGPSGEDGNEDNIGNWKSSQDEE